MNELQIFKNEEFGEIRTIIKGDEVWFVGKDVATALGYSDPARAVYDHVDVEDKTSLLIQQSGSNYKANTAIINESGLYSLVLSSKMPNAKKFKRWVTSEVLPSIRKNGMYMTSSVVEQAITNPTEFLAKAVLIANQELEKIKAENKIMKPKAEYFDDLVDRNTLTNFRDTAKMLHISPKKFISWLLERKFVYRDAKGKLRPYSQYVVNENNTKGYFEIKERKSKDGSWSGIQIFITPRGREAFRLLLSQKLIA